MNDLAEKCDMAAVAWLEKETKDAAFALHVANCLRLLNHISGAEFVEFSRKKLEKYNEAYSFAKATGALKEK